MDLFQGVSMTVTNIVQNIMCPHVICSKKGQGEEKESKKGISCTRLVSGLLTFVCLLQGFSLNFASRVCIDFAELLKVAANDA